MPRDVTHTWFFFGDSLTLGVNDYAMPGGWVSRLYLRGRREKLYELPPATFYNLGARRQTTAAVAARFEAEVQARQMPGIVQRLLFCTGVVDMAGPTGTEPGAVHKAAADLETLLERATKLAPTLVVCPPPVANVTLRQRIAELCAAQVDVCARLGVDCVNIHAALASDAEYMEDLTDGLHPGPTGCSVMAERLFADPRVRAFLTPASNE